MEYIDNYRDDIEEIRREEDNIGTGIFSNAKAIMDKLYIPLRFTNRLMIYDAVTREYEILRIGQNKYCYTDVCYDGSQLWLTTIDGDVFVWDRGSERTEKVFSYSQSRLTSNIRDGRSPYPYIFSDSEFIFVFDYVYPVIKINKNSAIWYTFCTFFLCIKNSCTKITETCDGGWILTIETDDSILILCNKKYL